MVKDYLLQTQKLLSQKVARHDKFLSYTSCLNIEERELIGYCVAFKKMFPNLKKFSKFLDNKAIPALKIIGSSKWFRSELTDLGLKLADKDVISEDLTKGENNNEYSTFEDEDI